jgi:hypothetical protein
MPRLSSRREDLLCFFISSPKMVDHFGFGFVGNFPAVGLGGFVDEGDWMAFQSHSFAQVDQQFF